MARILRLFSIRRRLLNDITIFFSDGILRGVTACLRRSRATCMLFSPLRVYIIKMS